MGLANVTVEQQIADLWRARSKDASSVLARSEQLLQSLPADLSTDSILRLNAARAVALSGHSRFDEAIEIVNKVEPLFQDAENQDAELEFELRRIRGRQALLQHRHAEALRLTLKNLELMSSQKDNPLFALAHSDVAGAYGISGNLRKALEHLQEGLQRTPESRHSQYGALLNNLGNVYMSLEREEEAMACFVRAREAFQQVGNKMQIAVTLSNEGRALGIRGHPERAIAMLKEALGMFKEIGIGHYVAATYYKLANAYAQKGDDEAAEAHYLKAFERIAEGNADGYEEDAREEYGSFLLKRGRAQEAREQFEVALEIVRQGGTQERIASILERVARALEETGALVEALAAYKELLALRDEMNKDPARSGGASETVQLERAVERDIELMQVTSRALVEANKLLAQQSRELRKLAMTDHLTGLYNRRHFSEKLAVAVYGSRKADGAYSVMFVDVDSFKTINDTFGHGTGDLVLQELARLFLSAVRETDVVARWGGEEFAVLLNGAGTQAARQIADKLRTVVADHDWQGIAGNLAVTVSAGVLSSEDYPQASADDVMRLADELLYMAKASGRNRTVWAADRNPAADTHLG